MANGNALKTEYCCSICGTPLTEENSRENAYTCWDCETKRFKQIEEANGTSIALFLMCGMVNLPLEPMILPYKFAEKEGNKWEVYCNLLKEKGKLEKNGKLRGFTNGVCDIREIFGSKMSYTDFSAYVEAQQELITEQEGTEEQREQWGTRPLWQNLDLTTDLYNELDRRFEAKISRYKGINIDEVLSDTLKKLCRLELVQEYLISIGDVTSFDKIQKSIDSIQAAEQLRKKDEKPIENFKIDAQIKALEDAGLVEEGKFFDFDTTRKKLLNLTKSTKYNYPLDMVDQMIFGIKNNMMANANALMSTELSPDLVFEDTNNEFEKEENTDYLEKSKFVGSVKVRPTKR